MYIIIAKKKNAGNGLVMMYYKGIPVTHIAMRWTPERKKMRGQTKIIWRRTAEAEMNSMHTAGAPYKGRLKTMRSRETLRCHKAH